MNDGTMRQLAEKWLYQLRAGFSPQEHFEFLRDVEKSVKNGVPYLDEIAAIAQHHEFNQRYKELKMAKVKAAPAPVAVPAKGKKEASAEGEESGKKRIPREPKIPETAKLIWANKENPKRAGSASHERYEAYKGSKTVKDFLEAGGTRGDLAHDIKHEFVSVA